MEACSEIALNVPAITADNQLVLPETTEGLTLGDYVPVLMQYRDINASLVFDYRDKVGNKEARSHVAGLRRIKAPINEIHKRLKADYKAIIDKMDADRRDALAVVEEMIEYHNQHLRDVDAEEKAVAERKRIDKEIIDCWDTAHEMNALYDQQRELDRQAAEQARIAVEQAAEQRRLQIEAEKKEAADKAAEEARIAEQARAAKAVEEARAEAERKVRMAKEEVRAKVEREKAEAEAEIERKRREEERAKADLANIKRVHWLIIPAMVAQGVTEDQAKSLIMAIRNGDIPALSIDYRWNG